jgi:hypothetical protein
VQRTAPTGNAGDEDPELEAYLSAPPSEAELRAIRGGFLRRNARLFAAITAAVALGGVLVALLLDAPRGAGDPAAAPATHEIVAARPNGSMPTPAPSIPGPILGRLRGPVSPAPVAAPRRSSDATAPRRDELFENTSPLQRAGDLVDDDALSPPASALPVEDPELDLPDLRPQDLVPAAELSNSHP